MDVLGFVLIGTITGIGGGTTRDPLLGRTVWWTQYPLELILDIRMGPPGEFIRIGERKDGSTSQHSKDT